MSIRNQIIQLIVQESVLSVPVTETTDLYKDLCLDSLSFISLLMDIEEQYHITIELSEMTGCRIVGQLIRLVENKVRKDLQND